MDEPDRSELDIKVLIADVLPYKYNSFPEFGNRKINDEN